MMADSAVRDGRPMVVFHFSDCDPAGWQMPISLSRKLQALKAVEFGDLEFQVHRVGLTPDQVREYGLPSTPLKDTERRADKWMQATGVEQTEIDALAALQPELLQRIAEESIAPFYDDTLHDRVRQARREWQERAQRVLDERAGEHLEELRADAAERLAEKRDESNESSTQCELIPMSLSSSCRRRRCPRRSLTTRCSPTPPCVIRRGTSPTSAIG